MWYFTGLPLFFLWLLSSFGMGFIATSRSKINVS